MESRLTISEYGVQRWYDENGRLHRIDGPAIIHPDGSEMWCQNDKIHRKDGPAIIYPSGLKRWFLNDQNYSFQEWTDELNLDQRTRLELVLKWNPE